MALRSRLSRYDKTRGKPCSLPTPSYSPQSEKGKKLFHNSKKIIKYNLI